ncbi:hypothetical protein ABIF74_011701 [Bradyrhizobium japonicum]
MDREPDIRSLFATYEEECLSTQCDSLVNVGGVAYCTEHFGDADPHRLFLNGANLIDNRLQDRTKLRMFVYQPLDLRLSTGLEEEPYRFEEPGSQRLVDLTDIDRQLRVRVSRRSQVLRTVFGSRLGVRRLVNASKPCKLFVERLCRPKIQRRSLRVQLP